MWDIKRNSICIPEAYHNEFWVAIIGDKLEVCVTLYISGE
jgi:hypothetical protein